MQRDFTGYLFTLIQNLDPLRDNVGNIIELMPQNRYAKRDTTPLNQYGQGPFCKFKIQSSREAGVYIITINDEPYYVGKCKNLAQRYNAGYGNISPKNCYQSGRLTNCRLNNLILRAIQENMRVSLWFMKVEETDPAKDIGRKTIESELISRLGTRARWNLTD